MEKVAYLVLAHTDPAHFGRLVQALGRSADVYVHIDKKADIEPFIAQAPTAFFVKERIRVSWAGFSMVTATLALMRAAMSAGEPYSHLVLLSGQDYPIKPPAEIYHHLTAQPGREFINFFDMRESPEHYMRHVKRRHFMERFWEHDAKWARFLDKAARRALTLLALPANWGGVAPYFGSQWWALTPHCCEYILRFVEENPQFVAMYRFAFAPDEHFFHTIVGNSAFLEAAGGVRKFEGRGTWRMANLHLVHPSLAKVYSEQDFAEVRASERFFVRKVASGRSDRLLEMIDRELVGQQVVEPA